LPLEPSPQSHEVDFILETASDYLARRPTRADILRVFTGIRPLVKEGDESATATLSRDHKIQISGSGLLTITGGKWTTYRRMTEDCVDHATSSERSRGTIKSIRHTPTEPDKNVPERLACD
jgi:glycerol-3-phosphate dehydrogenase